MRAASICVVYCMIFPFRYKRTVPHAYPYEVLLILRKVRFSQYI
ncbi:hypothetical protein BRYFOR_06025 [Marvinbryantia formatexigens DSM 14469]|uniref:Uncharacterized protein n=1 Tax=Marvinbryantia formatexigens DSM 14469 TaxID=478749 RepID=C6LBM9_9FIRM|nr:hypothetical protein BRYFOR_06025 [Marvinbryantia formatexigens DSM 14469]